MITYDPLWHILLDKKLKKLDLCTKTGMGRSTLAKMGKNEYVSLAVIEKICIALDCKIEDVVKISPND